MAIKLHHLRVGRSVFTAFLMEELGVPYELEIYERNEMGRAPPELKKAHPLGKSPVIEIDGSVLSESGAIAMVLTERYAGDGPLAPPIDGAARAEWMQWLHYPEGSGFLPLFLKLLLSREQEPKPMLISMFAEGEVQLHLGYLEKRFEGRDYVLGDHFTIPDVGVGYVANMAKRLGLLGGYPKLAAYAERITSREAFQRAAEKTGG
ncbi:glutathione S-transferase family protein [Parvularcula maris]|uniref:Glutathione S-transferase family protein n=1 Tax=Parvularcula maris TaxID=2965077 RepID=A0A9X2L6L0_9PROT|nr:glutathione S-transferase family protein [Parvularcula maris]MCQ8184028.1 glutathione S-transferase family protein [Parvularcula maris]